MRTPAGLLAITPGIAHDRASGQALARSIGEAFAAGLRAVSIREPGLPDGELLELTRTVLALAAAHEGAWVGLNDSVHVALAAGAQGVHLGFRSLPVAVAREVVGARLCLGYSAHAHDAPDAESVLASDYVTFGPVRETPSKAGWLEATGFAALRDFTSATPRPVLALGGLEPTDARAALEAGAVGVAAIRGVFGGSDIADRVGRFLEALESARERA